MKIKKGGWYRNWICARFASICVRFAGICARFALQFLLEISVAKATVPIITFKCMTLRYEVLITETYHKLSVPQVSGLAALLSLFTWADPNSELKDICFKPFRGSMNQVKVGHKYLKTKVLVTAAWKGYIDQHTWSYLHSILILTW